MIISRKLSQGKVSGGIEANKNMHTSSIANDLWGEQISSNMEWHLSEL
jgi:hypothetical protein